MNLRIIIMILVFGWQNVIVAQGDRTSQVEKDYQKFRKVFEKELEEYESDPATSMPNYHPASLPDWIFTIPPTKDGEIVAIGISDPGMELDEASELAILRAKSLIALFRKAKISTVADNYLSEASGNSGSSLSTKYVNFHRLTAAMAINQEQFRVVHQFKTSFDEVIVLLAYDSTHYHNPVTDSILTSVDYFIAERQNLNRFEMDERFEVFGLSKETSSQTKIDLFYYLMNAKNKLYEIVSRYNGNTLNLNRQLFRYYGNKTVSNQPQTSNIATSLSHGLWNAYLKAILKTIVAEIEFSDINLSNVTDNYSQNTRNLSREVMTSGQVFGFQGMHLNNNYLSVKIDRLND